MSDEEIPAHPLDWEIKPPWFAIPTPPSTSGAPERVQETAAKRRYPHSNFDDESELVRRATAAWHRGGETESVCADNSAAVIVDDKSYVVLRASDDHRLLGIYRVRAHDGILKRMKRWPIEVEGEK